MIDGSSQTLGQLSVQTARFLPRHLRHQLHHCFLSLENKNMTRFNVLRPQIDIMTLPSASAPPHLGRGMILLSATFIEMKLQSFLSPAGAERRRYQLLFDVT